MNILFRAKGGEKMRQNGGKRVGSGLVALAALLSLLSFFPAPLPVFAAETGEVYSEPDSRILLKYLTATEDDFNHATVDWKVSGGVAEAVTGLDVPPYTVFEGSRALYVTAEEENGENRVVLSKTPEKLSDPERFRYFVCAIFVPDSAEDAALSLSFVTRGGTYEGTKALISGRWQAVCFDLLESGLSGRVSSLTLTVSAAGEENLFFLLDTCGGAESERTAFALRYMTARYEAEDGIAYEEGERLFLTLNGENPSLEAEEPDLSDFSGGAGIRVRLRNPAGCRTLTLSYTTLNSPEYSDRLSLTEEIPRGEGEVSCTFPIPDSYIGKFRLTFGGASSGEVEILSVTPAACYTSPITVGEVSECRIDRERNTLGVRGKLSAGEAERYADSPLYLYELSPWEEVSAISTSRPAVANTRLNGTDFAFSLSLSGKKNELFKKYAVMIYYAGGLIPVGAAGYVTNPEALATGRATLGSSSEKGYYPLEGTPILDGVAHTAVEIRLNELVTLGQAGTLSHTAGDAACTLDAAAIERLDKLMKDYEACGISVNFLLRVSLSEDPSLNGVLCHPAAVGGKYAALNTATEEGVATLRAVCDFLAGRYASPGGVTSNAEGFVVGSGINAAQENYNMGNADLTAFTRAYTAAFRIVYNAVKSVSSNVSVYLPLGGKWFSGMTVTQTSSFDARTTLEAFSSCLAQGGNVDWKLSYDICPGEGSFAWENDSPDLTDEAATVNGANLEVLTGYLLRSEFLYNGAGREILLLETEPHTTEDTNLIIRQSADYVYVCLRLAQKTFDSVKAYIPAHPVNYKETLRYIDTNRFYEIVEYAREIIGAGRLDALIASVGTSLVNRHVTENAFATALPSAVKGETVLFGFSEGEAGWTGALNCSSVKSGATLGEREKLLRVGLSAAADTDYRGIVNRLTRPIDLSAAQYIGFDLQATVLPEGVDGLELLVVLWSGNSPLVSTGTVKAGEWSTVVVDLADFPGRVSCDKISLFVRGIDGQSIGEPTLFVGSIRAMSTVYSAAGLETALRPTESGPTRDTVGLLPVLGAGVLLVGALTWEGFRLFGRKKRREEP